MKRKVRVYAPCLECGGSYKEQGGNYLPVVDTDHLHQVAFGGMEPDYKSGGNWIPNDLKKGRCTPAPNPDCPKGSPQYNLAMTFKKHYGFHEKGGSTLAPQNTSVDDFGKNRIDYMKSYLSENTRRKMAEEMMNEYYANPYAMPMNDTPQMYDDGGEDIDPYSNVAEWLPYGYNQSKALKYMKNFKPLEKPTGIWDAFNKELSKPQPQVISSIFTVDKNTQFGKRYGEELAKQKQERLNQRKEWRALNPKERREQRRNNKFQDFDDGSYTYNPDDRSYTYYFQDGGGLPEFQTRGAFYPGLNPLTNPQLRNILYGSSNKFNTYQIPTVPTYNEIPVNKIKEGNYGGRKYYTYTPPSKTITTNPRIGKPYQVEQKFSPIIIWEGDPGYSNITQLKTSWKTNQGKNGYDENLETTPISSIINASNLGTKTISKPITTNVKHNTQSKPVIDKTKKDNKVTSQDVATFIEAQQNEKSTNTDIDEKGNVPDTENQGTGTSTNKKDDEWKPYAKKMKVKYRGFPYGRGRIKSVEFDIHNDPEWLRQQKQRAVNANVVNVSSQYPELQGKSPLKPGYTPTWHPPMLPEKIQTENLPYWNDKSTKPFYQTGSEYMGPITEEEWLRQQENNPFLSAVNPYVQPKSNDNYIEPITFGDAAKYNFNSGINTIPTIDRIPIKQYNTESELKKIDNPYLDDPNPNMDYYTKMGDLKIKSRNQFNKRLLGMGLIAGVDYITYLKNKSQEPDMTKITDAGNMFASIDGNRGDIGFGPDIPFRANQYTPVQFTGRGMAKWGGQKYKEGGSYDLTQSEIQAILNAGGEIEYI